MSGKADTEASALLFAIGVCLPPLYLSCTETNKNSGTAPHFLHNACVQIFACSSGLKEPEDAILTVVLSQTIAVLCFCE